MREYLKIIVLNVILFSLVTFVVGCSSSGGGSGRKLSELRTPPAEMQKVEKEISKSEFKEALGRSVDNATLRVIEVFYGAGQFNPPYPHYRIFGIGAGSVYELLGVENGDVLVALNGYIVANPNVFAQYVSLLTKEEGAEIEVIRQMKPTTITIKFSGDNKD